MLKQLREPFPDRKSPGKNFISLLGVGLFVSTFLFLLRPFGIGQLTSGTLVLLVCLGFGVVTVVFGVLFDFMAARALRIRTDMPSWTLGKWIVQAAILIVWIAVGNWLYLNWLIGWDAMSLNFLVEMLGNTLLIGIFPIVFSGLMIQLRATKANQQH